jgi:CubicO group peptidase (beta-lactamase class C family)
MAIDTPAQPVGQSATRDAGARRRSLVGVVKLLVGLAVWSLLAFFAAFAALGLFWTALPILMLQSAPAGIVFAVAAVILAITAGVYWVATRFVASKVVVRSVGATVAGVTLFACVVWAPTSYDDALYLARAMSWADSDVHDYEKFPSREIANAAPAFHFGEQLTPEDFRTIEYESNGVVQEAAFDEFLRNTDTTSFIVIKDGAIRYENYFNGYQRDSIVTSFSTAKSFTSALIGIAIDDGAIGSVHDPVVSYLPELRGRGLDELTVRDLLMMSTGVRFLYDGERGAKVLLWPFGDEAMSYMHPDLRNLALHLPASAEPPGAAFKYNPYNTILLGLILERATHMPVTQYLSERIWQPLGMEFPASWSLDSTRHGFEKMESGLNGRAIDFAKFGQLFLDNGAWNDTQVIPSQWVAESTAPDDSDRRLWLIDQYWRDRGGYYKYQWWGRRTADDGYRYSAQGHLGQIIAVFPATHTVIVRFGITEGGVDWDDVLARVAASLE